ncbi:hypothetical protein [Paludisphaera sp.]|uniref:hypothetical protein n=1 Tax=Paludisphaera sp. TaxID=2017432 RepID=UPI00301C07B5
MSVDLHPETIAPEVQAFLDAFDRLSEPAKRDALARLLRKSPPASEPVAAPPGHESVDEDELNWGEITEGDQASLVAEAFDAMDREEEAFARGERSRPR